MPRWKRQDLQKILQYRVMMTPAWSSMVRSRVQGAPRKEELHQLIEEAR